MYFLFEIVSYEQMHSLGMSSYFVNPLEIKPCLANLIKLYKPVSIPSSPNLHLLINFAFQKHRLILFHLLQINQGVYFLQYRFTSLLLSLY